MNAGTLLDDSVVQEATAHDPTAPFRSLLASRPSALRPVASAQVTYRVLLLEASRSADALLAEAVRAEIPDSEITRTAGVLSALALIELYHFDLFVVDGSINPEAELEVVIEFQRRNPTSEVIVTTTELATSGEDRFHVLQAPVNPLELIETIRGCRDRAEVTTTAVDPEDEGYFVVVLSRHTPMEVVQFKCLSGATTALDFIQRDGPGGRVWFAKGEIVHAEAGALSGEDALIDMINWPGGSIVEVSVPPPAQVTIDEPWTCLLMRAAYAADERKALSQGCK